MSDDMKRVLDKLDKIDEKQGEMNSTLSRLTTTVEVHERRSTMLEGKHEKLEERVDQNESFIDKVKGSWKLILIIGVLVSINAAIIKML